jgi:hypothetical protein
MAARATPADATLIDVLIDGFEKNEIWSGYHVRTLPLPDESTAIAKLADLAAEATRWKGRPVHETTDQGRRLVAWDDLEIRQAGRGVMVLVRAPAFSDWWHDAATWADDPMGAAYAWLAEDAAKK